LFSFGYLNESDTANGIASPPGSFRHEIKAEIPIALAQRVKLEKKMQCLSNILSNPRQSVLVVFLCAENRRSAPAAAGASV